MSVSLAYQTPEAAGALGGTTPLADLISGLSRGLDLAQGQPMGHAIRTCLIALRIADELRLSKVEKRHLYYAVLLKDAGGSANASEIFHRFGGDEIAAKREASIAGWSYKSWNGFRYALRHLSSQAPRWERMRMLAAAGRKRNGWAREAIASRSERGSQLARRMGFSEETAAAIRSTEEHWDGSGHPQELAGRKIPLAARVLGVAQTLEVFYTHCCAKMALDAVHERSGAWFDPDLARLALELSRRGALFADLETGRTREALIAAEPLPELLDEETMDRICVGFGEIADGKTPFTQGHSETVARVAERIAGTLGLKGAEVRSIKRAALLHDLGKLAVPNCILEKPEKLEPEEWQAIKKHPYYTMEILRRVEGFGEIAEIAASHHEKLDGSGYYRNLTAARLPLAARIVAVADVFDALSSERPQRRAYPLETVCRMMRSEAPRQLDTDCVEALISTRSGARRPGPVSLPYAQGCMSK